MRSKQDPDLRGGAQERDEKGEVIENKRDRQDAIILSQSSNFH